MSARKLKRRLKSIDLFLIQFGPEASPEVAKLIKNPLRAAPLHQPKATADDHARFTISTA
jgi:hypothetical protein